MQTQCHTQVCLNMHVIKCQHCWLQPDLQRSIHGLKYACHTGNINSRYAAKAARVKYLNPLHVSDTYEIWYYVTPVSQMWPKAVTTAAAEVKLKSKLWKLGCILTGAAVGWNALPLSIYAPSGSAGLCDFRRPVPWQMAAGLEASSAEPAGHEAQAESVWLFVKRATVTGKWATVTGKHAQKYCFVLSMQVMQRVQLWQDVLLCHHASVTHCQRSIRKQEVPRICEYGQ